MTTQKIEADASAASNDLQIVNTKLAVNFNRMPEKVGYIWSAFHADEVDRLVVPAIQEAVKAATAHYTAEQLITQRDKVKEEVLDLLKARLSPNGIMLTGISMTDFKFSDTFENAIEAKVTAEQNALAEKNKLAQVQYQAQQRVTQATAEAEAIKIQAQAITQQGGASYVQLQAIHKWDGKLPMQMIPGSTVPFLNLSYKKED